MKRSSGNHESCCEPDSGSVNTMCLSRDNGFVRMMNNKYFGEYEPHHAYQDALLCRALNSANGGGDIGDDYQLRLV